MLKPSCTENESVRRRKQKWARTHAPSEQWRHRLLQSCMQRMKDTRTRTLDERRKARARIVAEETHRLQDAAFLSDSMDIQNQGCINNVHGQAELLCLLEDLDAMLEAERREHDGGVNVIESLVREADDDVAELIGFHEAMASSDGIMCPVCCNACLQVLNKSVSCSCGLFVDCRLYEDVTLSMVRDRLAQTLNEHHNECTRRLKFQMRYMPRQHLWAGCQACPFDCVVL